MTKRDPSAFAETIPVWATALKHGYLEINFVSASKAIYFCHRCYKYRKALKDLQASISSIPGHFPSTPYDHLSIQRVDAKLIFSSQKLPEMSITDVDGEPIELEFPDLTLPPPEFPL